ncbi:MAG: hypothetical protein Q4D64_06395 [Prevotellaceae bacterium]|nr:hypothetical protein [Prevotellaceae bacterium]
MIPYTPSTLRHTCRHTFPPLHSALPLLALGINFSSEKGTIDGFLPKEL